MIVDRNKPTTLIIIIIMLTNSNSSRTITTTAYGNYKVACAIERKIKLMMQFIIFPFISSFFKLSLRLLSASWGRRLNSGHGTGYSLFIAATLFILFDSSALSHRLLTLLLLLRSVLCNVLMRRHHNNIIKSPFPFSCDSSSSSSSSLLP